ncbi:MAG: hypothetical protein NTV97_29055 [Alphaproteobacteria bacterium]|nr:hypothetical protein [Alphaproteobacteria bacterium]
MQSLLSRRPLLAALPLASLLIAGGARAEGALMNVQQRTFTAKPFKLQSGGVMPEIVVAYETSARCGPTAATPCC